MPTEKRDVIVQKVTVKEKPQKQNRLVIIIVVIIGIIGAFLSLIWWSAQPSQKFATWGEEPLTDNLSSGMSLRIDNISCNEDGSGHIHLIFENEKNEVCYWGTGNVDYIPIIGYAYRGNFHQVYPPMNMAQSMVAGQRHPINPGEYEEKILELPPHTLAVPGLYRIFVEGCGWVEFVLLEDGAPFWG